jgi:hypothetical protein
MKSSRRPFLPTGWAKALVGSLVVSFALAAPPSGDLQAQSPEAISAALGDLDWRHIGPVNMGARPAACGRPPTRV